MYITNFIMNNLPDNTCDETICLTVFKMNSLPDNISKCKKNTNNNKITFRIKLFIIIDIFVRFRTLFIYMF